MDLGHVLSVIAFVVLGLISIPIPYASAHRTAEQHSSSVAKPTDSAGAESPHPAALKAPPTT